MTKIRRVIKKRYYLKTPYRNATGRAKTKYKRTYTYVVYLIQFPKGFDVSDLASREVTFERRGDTITIRPNG